MTYEQKLAAMTALCGWDTVALKMRKPGDWYVSANCREVGGDGCLSDWYGKGPTPEAAINDDWRQLVEELPADRYIVIDAGDATKRKHVRWNGFMWEEVAK